MLTEFHVYWCESDTPAATYPMALHYVPHLNMNVLIAAMVEVEITPVTCSTRKTS